MSKQLSSTQSTNASSSSGHTIRPAAYYKKESAASHFLDQTIKLERSPYELTRDDPRPQAIELLYTGVSKEGQGRAAYLKDRKKEGPQERFGQPVTSAQEVGWRVPTMTYVMSPFARKPLIKETFYRQTGVLNHKI